MFGLGDLLLMPFLPALACLPGELMSKLHGEQRLPGLALGHTDTPEDQVPGGPGCLEAPRSLKDRQKDSILVTLNSDGGFGGSQEARPKSHKIRFATLFPPKLQSLN